MSDETFTGFVPMPAIERPAIRRVGLAAVRDALIAGVSDFRANPTHLVVLGLVYPVAGFIFARIASGSDALPLVYPLVAGFALLGPIAAVGLYDLSRQRERGGAVTWRNAFDVLRSPRIGAIAMLGAALAALFIAWLFAAQLIYNWTMPAGADATLNGFVHAVLHTQAGWALMLIGTVVGFVFATCVLVLGAFSIPLLVDRAIGTTQEQQAALAVATSLQAARANPVVVAAWGVVVALGLLIGTATLLVGFAIVMPVLGHGTWHLYRKVIA